MAIYRIEWKRSAEKQLRKLPREVVARIVSAVTALATDATPPGVRKLVGSECSYRVRVGDYRVVYSVFHDLLVIEVVRVGHRREVYR